MQHGVEVDSYIDDEVVSAEFDTYSEWVEHFANLRSHLKLLLNEVSIRCTVATCTVLGNSVQQYVQREQTCSSAGNNDSPKYRKQRVLEWGGLCFYLEGCITAIVHQVQQQLQKHPHHHSQQPQEAQQQQQQQQSNEIINSLKAITELFLDWQPTTAAFVITVSPLL